jgi:hypothetical protein
MSPYSAATGGRIQVSAVSGTGALEFFALREQAMAALGERFDIREFHDVVLGSGTVTLPMLREQVRIWLESKKAVSGTHAVTQQTQRS